MKQEEIRSSMTGCGPIQITCQECGHIDTYFRDDFRITAGTNGFFSDHPRNRLK